MGIRFLLLVLTLQTAPAQFMEGELRLTVLDPSGRGLPAEIELAGRSPQFRAQTRADANGHARLTRLPPGVYSLAVAHDGFETSTGTVEIRSAAPQHRQVTLALGAVATEITVHSTAPLLDRAQPGQTMHAGRERLEAIAGTTPGRGMTEIITSMPGWLLEANAVLHPRGSEYDTQYVIDGMPLYDNRSIAFAPPFETSEFEAVSVITGAIPAEYGRRLGGVIALDTRRAGAVGHSSQAAVQFGTYDVISGSLAHQYRGDRTALALGLQAGTTDRYLDPPSLENFNNSGSGGDANVRFERDLGAQDRLTLYVRSNRASFLVPNDLVQQAAGQRQDRSLAETSGQVHYQRVFSPGVLASVRGMVRDLDARLWSNTLATPVYARQDRGFLEGAVIATLTIEGEHNTVKLGGDVRVNNVRESFAFTTGGSLDRFDLDFAGRGRATESSAFLQDHVRLGNFAAMLGLRFDQYSLRIRENALSPRVALSYYVPAADLLLRASYDRIFQPPPLENLLLSSDAASSDLDEVRGAIPVPSSRAHFFEVGFRKPLWNRLRIDASHYWRTFRNFIDDDVFLNTGVSIPITFDTARIQGTEVRLELPRWRGVSSFVSYSNMVGYASSPVTGGLFIRGGEADELREEVRCFPISQDQRNTLAAQVTAEPHRRVWLMTGIRYGSGLPVELEDDDDDDDEEDDDDDGHVPAQPIAETILEQVDFERGRVRPNFSLDAAIALRFRSNSARSLSVQVDVRNATNRLNVINFSGLFSGTALAPGRQVSVRLLTRF
jgi:hypothetical protein